ncbi:hypothetical protein niasHT_023695 [Heterodera trifolii]|uniref:Uncharacterized protein n=1 Tax=Heterodera trifolii TaxID=157864 RepID=A0ABD2JA52_9BILA
MCACHPSLPPRPSIPPRLTPPRTLPHDEPRPRTTSTLDLLLLFLLLIRPLSPKILFWYTFRTHKFPLRREREGRGRAAAAVSNRSSRKGGRMIIRPPANIRMKLRSAAHCSPRNLRTKRGRERERVRHWMCRHSKLQLMLDLFIHLSPLLRRECKRLSESVIFDQRSSSQPPGDWSIGWMAKSSSPFRAPHFHCSLSLPPSPPLNFMYNRQSDAARHAPPPPRGRNDAQRLRGRGGNLTRFWESDDDGDDDHRPQFSLSKDGVGKGPGI